MSYEGQEPRLAEEKDLSAVRGVIDAAYAKYLTRMDSLPAPMLCDIQRRVEAGQVWVVGDPVIAVICLMISKGECLLIENVAVHPNAQGDGIGRRLMNFAEAISAELGLSKIQLYTNEIMCENVDIYSHLGYVETDRRSDQGYRRVFMEKIISLT